MADIRIHTGKRLRSNKVIKQCVGDCAKEDRLERLKSSKRTKGRRVAMMYADVYFSWNSRESWVTRCCFVYPKDTRKNVKSQWNSRLSKYTLGRCSSFEIGKIRKSTLIRLERRYICRYMFRIMFARCKTTLGNFRLKNFHCKVTTTINSRQLRYFY